MESNPKAAHFETFGSVAKVLKDVGENIPLLFPDKTEDLLTALNVAVPRTAQENKWDVLAVILTRGLARPILNDLTNNPFPHKGSIFVDPIASTPEFTMLETDQAFKSCKERLIRANESEDDVLLVMYGLEEIDRTTDYHLLMRSLRMAAITLDLIINDDIGALEERATRGEPSERDRLLKLAQKQLAGLMLTAVKNKNLDHANAIAMKPAISQLYHTIAGMLYSPNDPIMGFRLRQLLTQVAFVPMRFMSMGVDLTPFLDTDHPMVLNAGLTKLKRMTTVAMNREHDLHGIDPRPVEMEAPTAPTRRTITEERAPELDPE